MLTLIFAFVAWLCGGSFWGWLFGLILFQMLIGVI